MRRLRCSAPESSIELPVRSCLIAGGPSEEQSQSAGKLIMVRDVERAHDLAFRGHQLCERRIDHVLAGIGQPNQDTAPVVGMIMPGDKSAVGEPVYAIGHGS